MTADLHLDYATRDYDGFRQLLLSVIDRRGTEWSERAAADVGIMVVELLAYELDRLAYAGDRVSEEGFLATARRRESARRHAALGDYVLDRGNATRGLQWFELATGCALPLPARTVVATPADPRDRSAMPVYAETIAAAELDARRNWFRLVHAAPAGSRALRLALGAGRDLRALGVASGQLLIVGQPLDRNTTPPGQRLTPADRPLVLADGEVVQVARVMARGVELVQPVRRTWPAGADGACVLGNVVEVRRGITSEWTLVGRGGAAVGEVPDDQLVRRRIDVVRRLRIEVEDGRAAWRTRPALRARWKAAHDAMTRAGRRARDGELGVDQIGPLLDSAAAELRAMLVAIERDIPDDLVDAGRVAWPGQTIDLPVPSAHDDAGPAGQPILWMDPDRDHPERSETLAVAVGVAGSWTRWTEQPDLLRSGPDAHHYVVEIDGNSRVALRFGDGQTGAILPAGCQVMARWVTGDEAGDDLHAGALTCGRDGALPAGILATSNPLPTTGGRPPEALDGSVAARVALGLDRPAVPVTAADYQAILALRDPREIRARGMDRIAGRIAESRVTAAHGRVDLVIRPASGVAAGALLEATRDWVERNRLAGTTVEVRLARSLAIDIGVVVEVHPDLSAAELRRDLQRELTRAFGDTQPVALGRKRERSEVYRVIEKVPGVLWSQVVVFDLAGRKPAGALEVIAPAADQVVRCAGDDDQAANGTVTCWTARRYSLRLAVRHAARDAVPDLDAIRQLVSALLSGPSALPVQRGWTVLDRPRIDDALAGVFAGARFRACVAALIVDRVAVDQLHLAERQLPILDSVMVDADQEAT